MSEFVTLAESKEKFVNNITKNASFIAVVLAQGEVKNGTKKSGEAWTNRQFTIQDASATEQITAWGDEMKLLKVGYKYEFNSPYWSVYQEKPQLAIGQYCQVKCIGGSEKQETLEEQQEEVKTGEKLPEVSELLTVFTRDENLRLSQIEKIVIEEMKKYDPMGVVNGQKVGLRVKEIYRQFKDNGGKL